MRCITHMSAKGIFENSYCGRYYLGEEKTVHDIKELELHQLDTTMAYRPPIGKTAYDRLSCQVSRN